VSSTLTVEGVMVASYICPAIGFHRCLHIVIVTTVNITIAFNFFTVQIRICNLLLLATSLS
jgi:hypothetical protein